MRNKQSSRVGILYYFPNKGMSMEARIHFLVSEYVRRNSIVPHFVSVNSEEGEILPEVLSLSVIGVEGMVELKVMKDCDRMENHFWIGVYE